MYDNFIEWVVIPIYRFIIKPFLFCCKCVKMTVIYIGKFLSYLMFATTGNMISIPSVVFGILSYKLPPVAEQPAYLFIVIPIGICFCLVLGFMFIYNICNWMFSYSGRKEIIEKEPEFIQNIVEHISYGFHQVIKDAKKNDNQIQELKNLKKQKKALKIERKRLEKEKRLRELDVINSRSEIIDIRK